MAENKKIFPKIQKKLKSFLADESWKITKKDALGIGAWIGLLASIDTANAWVTRFEAYDPSGRSVCDDPLTVWSPVEAPWCGVHTWIDVTTDSSEPVCSHSSWIVNGHYSASPDLVWGTTTVTSMDNHHASHGSHGSHGSHWSRW